MRMSIVCATLCLLYSTAVTFAGEIVMLQWNPHWQCFEDHPECSAKATAMVAELLTTKNLDFANLIELETTELELPAGWVALGDFQSCGHDWDSLIYNAKRWRVLANTTGCMLDSRSYTAARFMSIADPSLGEVLAIGAHYPQTLNASSQGYEKGTAALKQVIKTLGGSDQFVIMADTNTEGPVAAAASPEHHGVNKTNGQLLVDLGVWGEGAGAPPGAKLFNGCCYNDNFSWQGDRIVANFGRVTSSEVLFNPAPAWAAFNTSEFHRAVVLTLQV